MPQEIVNKIFWWTGVSCFRSFCPYVGDEIFPYMSLRDTKFRQILLLMDHCIPHFVVDILNKVYEYIFASLKQTKVYIWLDQFYVLWLVFWLYYARLGRAEFREISILLILLVGFLTGKGQNWISDILYICELLLYFVSNCAGMCDKASTHEGKKSLAIVSKVLSIYDLMSTWYNK